MKWIKRPTKEGWYWAVGQNMFWVDRKKPAVIYLKPIGDSKMLYDDIWSTGQMGGKYMGPLETPEVE